MKSKITKLMLRLPVLVAVLIAAAGLAVAQPAPVTPTPSPSPAKAADTQSTGAEPSDEMGDYKVVSSLELGFRGLKVRGDLNKYQSDLNYKAGPVVFDSSLFMQSKSGHSAFDTLMMTSTGWGSDPYGNTRISIEKPEWYRLDGTYRWFRYYNFLNNLANPNFATQPPNPVTGEHGYNVRQKMGDIDLTLLPKNEKLRFNLGFSTERYAGPAFTTYHDGGDDFMFLQQFRSTANDARLGVDGKIGSIDFSFLQGFRRFRDDSYIDNTGQNLGANPALSNAFLTSVQRSEGARSSVNYSRLSAHTLVAKKLDLTARILYSSATSNFDMVENLVGVNFNTRITGALNPPNILNLGQLNMPGDTKRPNTLGDFGLTYLASDRLRISNTFRVETFQINGGDIFNDAFFISRSNGTPVAPIIINNLGVYKVTKYRKYQDTVEVDYQFNDRYSAHVGYRYGSRWIEQILSGFSLNSYAPVALVPEDETETNHTNSVFGGFKARPAKNWTIFFDAEHGQADNVFTRLGNYDYTNVRAKSRWAPNRKVTFSLGLITRNNSNPSEIAGVSLQDFGLNIRTRVFTSSLDWAPTSRLSFNAGYNYNWVDSDAIVNYFYNAVQHPVGHSLYFVRNNFFSIDSVAQLARRVTLYAAYRINKDTGQGSRLTDPAGTPGFLVTSYPINFQSPEAKLSFKLSNRLDWNVGYQYYNYVESPLVGPRPQNYRAHMPYTSLRLYFGRKE